MQFGRACACYFKELWEVLSSWRLFRALDAGAIPAWYSPDTILSPLLQGYANPTQIAGGILSRQYARAFIVAEARDPR